ncbi:hypothetical protein BHE74_00017020 [Ensete ventricosum]|nr:hypothetical protein GW17_00026225 [Ensete ventricosum]RWW74986.1 hypothetical protein BHE74_00017020 [Ensete ventricosum]RZR79300.1 hypothetical protein BHM03_00005006 [Ensete ventricosum]
MGPAKVPANSNEPRHLATRLGDHVTGPGAGPPAVPARSVRSPTYGQSSPYLTGDDSCSRVAPKLRRASSWSRLTRAQGQCGCDYRRGGFGRDGVWCQGTWGGVHFPRPCQGCMMLTFSCSAAALDAAPTLSSIVHRSATFRYDPASSGRSSSGVGEVGVAE